jgi:nuclear transport factor 2 (NTF2) superfamily protein
MTIASKIISILTERPGLSDKELTLAIFDAGKALQQINTECLYLAQTKIIVRRKRSDGILGNYMLRPPFPPFNAQTAALKARMAEDAWNMRDPARVALAYTEDTRWRNRAEFLQGREAVTLFLERKWARELDYRLIKEVWAFQANRIAVRFAYEWHDGEGQWFRSYGNENWEFDEQGLMRLRLASINDLPILECDRKYHWPLGRRPDDHPSLSELGL